MWTTLYSMFFACSQTRLSANMWQGSLNPQPTTVSMVSTLIFNYLYQLGREYFQPSRRQWLANVDNFMPVLFICEVAGIMIRPAMTRNQVVLTSLPSVRHCHTEPEVSRLDRCDRHQHLRHCTRLTGWTEHRDRWIQVHVILGREPESFGSYFMWKWTCHNR